MVDPVVATDQVRTPEGSGGGRGGLVRRVSGVHRHGEPGPEQGESGGQTGDSGSDHENVRAGNGHTRNVSDQSIPAEALLS